MGARLDERPELFFQLRSVDQSELIMAAGAATTVGRTAKSDKILKSSDLSSIFGIDVDSDNGVNDIVSKPKKKISLKNKAVKKTKVKKQEK
jgi:hypothetical protein